MSMKDCWIAYVFAMLYKVSLVLQTCNTEIQGMAHTLHLTPTSILIIQLTRVLKNYTKFPEKDQKKTPPFLYSNIFSQQVIL